MQSGTEVERLNPFPIEQQLGDREVLVRVTHCSVARGDVKSIDNDWGDTRFPLIPGHEIVGLVEETGPAVTDLMTGDRVGIGYQQSGLLFVRVLPERHRAIVRPSRRS